MHNGSLTRDSNFFKNTICGYKVNLVKKIFFPHQKGKQFTEAAPYSNCRMMCNIFG